MKARHFLVVILLASPVLLIGEANAFTPLAQPQAVTRAEKQERCENLCLDCMESGEGQGSLCMTLFELCCQTNSGIRHSECGCRMEM